MEVQHLHLNSVISPQLQLSHQTTGLFMEVPFLLLLEIILAQRPATIWLLSEIITTNAQY